MCGIVGVVGGAAEELAARDPGLLERTVSLLDHRGPDDRGVWRSPQAHLGHTRLSILDLSRAGRQPMELGSLVLTYNGEIYNFRQLRDALPGPFRSETDTEVVLHAYREHGEDCLHRFRGMFAFAIWDAERRRLFAARDRLGIKPFYYRPLGSGSRDGVAFASEVEPLLDLGSPSSGAPPLDDSALADYLTYGYVPTPKTAWRGIHKLGAGEKLTWQDGELHIERYWTPEIRPTADDLGEGARQLDDLLAEIVPEQTLSDVPVGVFLSGGLDSATVTSYLEGCSTFTLGQPEASRDEAPAARRVARHFHTDHHEEEAEIPDLVEAVDTMVSVYGEPFGDSAALSVWLLSRLTRKHVTVALSGEGGDEILCGYRWYGRSMRDPASAWSKLGARVLPTFSQGGRSFQRRSASGFERYASFLGVFTPRQIAALPGPRLRQAAEEDPLWHFRRHWREDLPLVQRLQWADLHTYLPDDLLTKVDRASMAFSLEVRPPLLDHRLVEWALGCADPLKRDPVTDRGKVVLRRLIGPRLPEGHLELPKRGFNLAIRRWAKGSPGLLEGALRRLEGQGIIRRPGIFRLTNEQTWSLLMLDRWLLRHDAGYGDA